MRHDMMSGFGLVGTNGFEVEDESSCIVAGSINVDFSDFCNIKVSKVVFKPPRTIVYFSDGDKVIVKTTYEDEYNPEVGVAMAVSRKALGSRNVLKSIVNENLPTILTNPEYLDWVYDDVKIATLRRGRKKYSKRLYRLKSNTSDDFILIDVVGTRYLKFRDLTIHDIVDVGFLTYEDFIVAITQIYSDIDPDEEFTLVHFEKV